jgi:hypothetical protein
VTQLPTWHGDSYPPSGAPAPDGRSGTAGGRSGTTGGWTDDAQPARSERWPTGSRETQPEPGGWFDAEADNGRAAAPGHRYQLEPPDPWRPPGGGAREAAIGSPQRPAPPGARDLVEPGGHRPVEHEDSLRPAAPEPGGQWFTEGTGRRSRADVGEQSAPLAAGQAAAPGTVIGGRYALRTAIGHGGMGTVWRATDTLLRRDVAVKEVLLPRGLAPSDRDAMYQRTLREARAAAALSHPAVVQVYDVVTDGGRPWIVMELLQARSLAEMIVEDGPLAARGVAKIGLALLGALEVAHAAGVLHRDVKPANVLICSDGRCVLTDFGVARMPTDAELTTPGMVLGSPHFISPERAVGARFGPPSDLFSLGVTLYTAVEGHPPFDKSDPFETMRAVVEEPPAPAMRAGALAGVLYGLLEKDPARRWDVETARAVLRDLLSGALISATPANETDPYAVVRPAPWSPPVPAPANGGQIGGRAMLAPGESLSGAIRRLRADQPRTDQDAAGPHTGEMRVEAPSARGGGRPGRAAQPPDLTDTGLPLATEMQPVLLEPGRRPDAAGYPPGQPRRGGHARTPAPRATAMLDGAAAGVRDASGRALGTLRRSPRAVRLGVLAGAGLLVLALGVGSVVALSGGSSAGPQPVVQPSASPDTPLIEVQTYQDAERGLTVNVPKGWTKSGSSFIDFVDPHDKRRKVRINVENAGTRTPLQMLEGAETRLKDPRVCTAPYNRVDLRDAQLAGRPANELEYTCGTGDQMRHGIWRVIVVAGKSYSFYLTVPDSRYQESKIIYDEMVRSFQLQA